MVKLYAEIATKIIYNTIMKYLISPIQLGQLLQEDSYHKRLEIIDNIISLYYIVGTSDNYNLDDHIKINKPRRKQKK